MIYNKYVMELNLPVIVFSSFVIALSGALVPGPLFTITVADSAKKGFIAGPLIILGHGILELAMITLLIAGIAPFLKTPTMKTLIYGVGGVVLVVMGILLLKDARTAVLDPKAESKQKKGMNSILAGIVGSLANPYWVIWWITIGLGYLVSSMKFGVIGIVAFFAGHISADLAWYSMISFAIAKGRKIIGDKTYRGLLAVCGVFLIGFGIWFINGMRT